MIPPACECGHPMDSHTDRDGFFTACAACACDGYLGHSTIVLG